jgi:peptidoglycan/xylan/chitin deacetylase (PgdA/CDA1 family)
MIKLLKDLTILRERAELLPHPNQVALTFDDGPNQHRQTTQRLLRVLEEHQVKAAFCLVGRRVRELPRLVRQIHEHGHLLVNHTFTHPMMWRTGTPALREEFAATDRAIADALGRPDYQSRCFRPPAGIISASVRDLARERELGLATLSYFAADPLYGPAHCRRVLERTLRDAREQQGGVYVFHDFRARSTPEPVKRLEDPGSGANRSWVPEVVEELIVTLRAEHFNFVHPEPLYQPVVPLP